jgi:hypothetical protein
MHIAVRVRPLNDVRSHCPGTGQREQNNQILAVHSQTSQPSNMRQRYIARRGKTIDAGAARSPPKIGIRKRLLSTLPPLRQNFGVQEK